MRRCHHSVTNGCSSSGAAQNILSLPKRRRNECALRRAKFGDRRVRLLAGQDGRYTVTIEVRGPEGAWADISLVADRDLARHTASLWYRLRLTEQEARAIAWGNS